MRLPATRPGPNVLLLEPGPRASEAVHVLLQEGAIVTVEAPVPDARLRDLANRGLVTLVDAADPRDFDVSFRDPHDPHKAPVAPDPVPAGALGEIILVGGGPGDLGLLTLAGLAEIEAADVVVCDRLAPLAVLDKVRPGTEVVHVGKIPRGEFTPQEQITEILVARALAGKRVVRLKGGDGFVFGRGAEEWNDAVSRGVPVRVIPGVSSSTAVPGLAGIPLTHRALTHGFVVVSGHLPPGDTRQQVDWEHLAGCGLTIVILMGVAALPGITAALIRGGLDPDTPAATIADGSMPSMRWGRATLSTIAAATTDAGIAPPVVTVIGAVVTALDEQR